LDPRAHEARLIALKRTRRWRRPSRVGSRRARGGSGNYNQLVNFRTGRRHSGDLDNMVEHLSDTSLQEIAECFAPLELPYPHPRRPLRRPCCWPRV